MLDYIVNDLTEFRQRNADESLGAMVVCDTSEQAKELYKQFKEKYAKENSEEEDSKLCGKARFIPTKASLILHDVNDKVTRKSEIEDFKIGKIDVLFVYNMLLTGFDAKRLKKLYLARVVKDHNLLQTLTRVNRPYKNYKYGFVVDFADISAQFEKANYNYLEELKAELGDEMEHYSNLFKTRAEIENEIAEIKETLFHYDTTNRENFSNQITEINDKKRLLELLKQLINAKELRNIIRLQGEEDLLKNADFSLWHDFRKIVLDRIEMLKFIETINEGEPISNLLNVALEDIYFQFVKVSESELKISDELQQKLRRTREEMQLNFDPKDPQFVSLKEELERIFRSKNLNETTQEGMQEHIRILDKIYDEVKEINRKNTLLKEKYKNRIQVYVGIEADFYSGFNPKLDENLGFDFRIGSVHYIKDKEKDEYYCVDNTPEILEYGIKNYANGDEKAFIEAYFDNIVEMVHTQKPDIIGHLDLVKKFNKDFKYFDESAEWYKNKVEYVLDEIAKSEAIVEINTGGMSRGWTQTPYPSFFILERILAKNIPITISSDAHETQNIDFYFDESLEIIRKIGFKSVKILKDGKFQDFNI